MKLTLTIVMALAAFACACAPGGGPAAPKGWEGKWTGALTAPAAEKEPEAEEAKGQSAPSFNDDLAGMLGGYELELKSDNTFSLSMAGVEVEGNWEEQTGMLALSPQSVMGESKAKAKPEMADFFTPIAAELDGQKKEIRLRAGDPWPDVDFRRPGAEKAN